MYLLTFVSTVGALQGGIILASIIFRFKHQKYIPLALLLIVFSVRLATIPTWNPEVLISRPWILPLTTPLPFLFGPFLWWYIREISRDTRNIPKYGFLHVLPFCLEVLAVTITLLRMSPEEYELFINGVFSGNPPLWLPVRNGLKVILNVIYVGLSARLAFGKDTSGLSSSKRLWLRFLVIMPAVVLIAFAYVAVPAATSEYMVKEFATPFFILSVSMAIMIYGVSYLLLISPHLHRDVDVSKNKTPATPFPDEECERLVSLVENRLAEGAFHNPDLVLTDLAAEFSIHPNRLSYALNQHFNYSFRTLLNKIRLDYFLQQIGQGELQNQSILGLAFDAGFPSKSTFNRFFKNQMGMSPSSYIKSIQQ